MLSCPVGNIQKYIHIAELCQVNMRTSVKIHLSQTARLSAANQQRPGSNIIL
jgi:hypothetical protein